MTYCARTGIGGGPVDNVAGGTEGSIWTSGVSGQGIQLHGEFDWTTLDKNNTASMDYCATPTIIGVTARVARHNDWRSMSINVTDGGKCGETHVGNGCGTTDRGSVNTVPNGTDDGDVGARPAARHR